VYVFADLKTREYSIVDSILQINSQHLTLSEEDHPSSWASQRLDEHRNNKKVR
jgi:hypothetical protein